MEHFDFLIVGAGFAGTVLAEHIATQLGKTCLIVERRNHIGGNAYDHYDKAGVQVHDYGPHYFRTNSQRIVDLFEQIHRLARRRIQNPLLDQRALRQFLINLNTFEQLIGRLRRPNRVHYFRLFVLQARSKCPTRLTVVEERHPDP